MKNILSKCIIYFTLISCTEIDRQAAELPELVPISEDKSYVIMAKLADSNVLSEESVLFCIDDARKSEEFNEDFGGIVSSNMDFYVNEDKGVIILSFGFKKVMDLYVAYIFRIGEKRPFCKLTYSLT